MNKQTNTKEYTTEEYTTEEIRLAEDASAKISPRVRRREDTEGCSERDLLVYDKFTKIYEDGCKSDDFFSICFLLPDSKRTFFFWRGGNLKNKKNDGLTSYLLNSKSYVFLHNCHFLDIIEGQKAHAVWNYLRTFFKQENKQ